MQHDRSFTVNYTPEGAFAEKYPALADLPFLLDSRPGFHRLGNAFLNDRGLGLWAPGNRGDGPRGHVPTPRSMHNYAQWLANFLEWANLRGVDLATCDYATHVMGRYQKEMVDGLWSRSGKGLAPRTINLRVQQACDFLCWMGQTGRRAAFQVPYETARLMVGSATSSAGHLAKEVRVRKGKVRPEQKRLRIPTDEQIRQWRHRVLERYGPTSALMCDTVLLTAMRREEVVCLRTDTLPESRSDWHIENPTAPPVKQNVGITIRFGTKGQSYGKDAGDKIGPARNISIPLTLALQWDDYRRGARNAAFAEWMKGVRGTAKVAHARKAVHLFLRESDGARFSGSDFYTAWVGVELPGRGWSPHKGRHWWACSMLWREMNTSQGFGHLSQETPAALLEKTALDYIRLIIQPQLGHASSTTTMIYLKWVREMLGVPLSLDGDAAGHEADDIQAQE